MNFCTGRWKRFWPSGRNFEVGKAGRYRVANHHDRGDDDAELDVGRGGDWLRRSPAADNI
jgi:hypothetical protein